MALLLPKMKEKRGECVCEHICARGDQKSNCGAKLNKGIKGQFTEKETNELQSFGAL